MPTRPHRWKAVALLGATTMAIGILGIVPAADGLSHQAAIAKAKKVLLVRSDFPSGWTTSSSSSGGKSPLSNSELASCLGVPLSQVTLKPPKASSPEFDQKKEDLSVDNEVSVFPTSTVGLQQFNLFESTKTPVCIATIFNSSSARAQFTKSLPSTATLGAFTVTSLPSPGVGQHSGALAIEAPITAGKTTITVSVVLVIILSNRMGSQLDFTSTINPFPASLEAHLERISAQRIG